MDWPNTLQVDLELILQTLKRLGQPSLKKMLIRNHGVS